MKKKRASLAKIIILCCIQLCSIQVHASISELNNPDRGLSIRTDSLIEVSNSLIGVTLEIKNQSTEDLFAKIQFSLPRGVTLISARQNMLTIPAGQKMFVPVRLDINQKQLSGDNKLEFYITDSVGTILDRSETIIHVPSKRLIIFHNITEDRQMRHVGDSVHARIALRNVGNTLETVKMVVSAPNATGNRDFLTTEIEAYAGLDTVISLGYLVNSYMLDLPQFTVNIAAMYSNEDVLGATSIAFHNVSAVRDYRQLSGPGDASWLYNRNRLTFSVRNLTHQNRAYYLNAHGDYTIGDNEYLRFNTFAYQWQHTGNNRPVLNNTWINYEKNNKGFTVGNFSESMDFFFYGRGAKIYFGDQEDKNRFEVGIADKEFDLLESSVSGQLDKGISVYAKTVLGQGLPEKKKYTGTAYYDYSPIDNSESILYMNTFDLVKQKHHERISLAVDFGTGISRELVSPDSAAPIHKPSMAGGIRLHTQLKNYLISSDNFYSTGYFPGVRRGAINSQQRISKKWGRSNTWLGFNLYEYAPKSFLHNQLFNSYYSALRGEAGVSFPIGQFASLSINPSYNNESGRFFATADIPQRIEMTAARIGQTLNVRSRDYKHHMYLTVENGIANTSIHDEDFWQLRTYLSYNYQHFNLYLNYQYGSFLITEELNKQFFDTDHIYRFTVTPAFRQQFFRKKIETELSLTYGMDSYSGSNLLTNTRLQYAFARNTAVYCAFQYYYTAMKSAPQAFTQGNLQFGIIKNLPQSTGNENFKRGNLQVFCFYDNNNNGIWDDGDMPATDHSVLINKTLFITNNKGIATFKNVPQGQYLISPSLANGWYASDRQVIVDRRKTNISIPLQKLSVVTGRIQLNYNPELDLETSSSLSGYIILAQSITGEVVKSVTNHLGQYTLSLPEGTHQLTLDPNSFPKNVYCTVCVQSVSATSGSTNQAPDLILNVRKKNIEIQRFSSNP